MEFEIQNKVVVTPMEVILRRIRNQLTNGKLQIIEKQNKDNIKITCPVHKDGLERHPSCNIFANRNDPVTQYGMCHCFACGYSAPLDVFVNSCFDKEGDFGKQWLLDNCDTAFLSEVEYLPEIVVESTKKSEIDVMPEESLHKYAYYHEYMWKRKLTKEIVDLFEVGYDPERDTLVFPVRDEFGRLRFITRRSVSKHFFMIPEDVDKPVYLLYYILQHHIESIAVCESQINALHMWSCGIPAVALFSFTSCAVSVKIKIKCSYS